MLAPMEASPPTLPPPGADAIVWLDRWRRAAEAWVADPGDEAALRATRIARRATAEHAERWLAWVESEGGDRAPAEEVCRIASEVPERCTW